MGNFLRSLFGSKKSSSKIKPRMQSRRLELIGLEERITPATIAFGTGADIATVVITLDATESITDLNTSTATAVITVNTVGSNNNTTALAPSSGVTVTNNTVVINTAVLTGFTGIVVYGGSGVNAVTVGATGIDLTAGTTPVTAQIVHLDLTTGGGADTLTVSGAIKTKGAGAAFLSSPTVSIGAAGDITTAAGNVLIIGTTISTAGDVTTAAGNIVYNGATTLTGATSLTTTGGTITLGTVGGAFGLTTSSGAGNVSVGAITGLGALSITTAPSGSNGTIGLTGAVTAASVTTVGTGAVTLGGTVTSTGPINFAGAVTGTTSVNVVAGTTATFGSTVNTPGAISVLGLGDLTFTGSVGNTSATSVTAKSLTGDVIFGNTVTSSNLGGFISEATSVNKATKIANLVTLAAGANALVTGNLIANNSTLAAITTSGVGNITITGNVDASVAGNDLALTAGSGAVSIIGNVGSGSTAFGTLTASGTGTFLAAGTVTAGSIKLDQANKFATSITFAKAVTVSDSPGGLEVNASGSGTVTFSDTITALGAASNNTDIEITSVNGAINVGGAITGLDKVAIISSGSGSITLIGNVTTSGTSTTQDNGDIFVQSATGNITTVGVISTAGSLADIEIDTVTSGNVIIGNNVSTSGGGDIILGADSVSTSSGTGILTINGTVTTTGAAAGDIILGVSNGSAAVNKAVTAGATGDVVFVNTVATDAFTIASGATITAGDDVFDAFTSGGAAGVINLGANITALNDTVSGAFQGIALDNSVNLTGAVSMKASGTSGVIGLTSVNGNQNLTLEATGGIFLISAGQTTALNTVTVTNSAGVTAGALTASKVVLSDTTGNIVFGNGGTTTVITNSLTTAAKAYNVSFAGTSVISGAPVFLNTGAVSFAGTTSLTTGATITGNSTSTASLAGTIVSGGAFNIGAIGSTTINTTSGADTVQLILNSSSAASTIASKVTAAAADKLSLLGVGSLTLSGDSSTSGFDGSIDVTNGTLNVTGKLGATSVSTATSGTISGAGGTIGILNVNTGTVAPGGTLNTAAVTLNAATNYSAAVLTTATASNLKTASAINIGGATLSLSSVAAGLAVNGSFTIINNTAASTVPIGGTFANQAEGSSISAKDTAGNTVAFTVSYKGGDGNDVTLKVTSITTTTPAPTAPAQPMVAGQPALNKFTAIGADAGGAPQVTITFQNGTFVSFLAYASTFKGGVRVALGDVDGNGSTDVITGAGPGGGPQVNVYNVNNATGAVSLQKSLFAFSAPSFTGGVYVAAGDTNADGFDDVIIGAGKTGGSRVQVYAGSATGVVTTSTLNDFFAYSPAFTGGVVVAAGQRNAVAGDEIITAPASSGGYNIKSFNANGTGNTPTVVDNFFAFNNTTSVGGLSLAVGILNSGSIADLIIGTSNGGYGVIVDSATAGIAGVPFAGFTGAIRAGVAEDANGQDFAVALAGPTGGPRISVFSVGATSLTETDNLFVMNTSFKGGLFGTPTL